MPVAIDKNGNPHCPTPKFIALRHEELNADTKDQQHCQEDLAHGRLTKSQLLFAVWLKTHLSISRQKDH